MNKFQRKVARAARKEQTNLYDNAQVEFNIEDLSDCQILHETNNPDFDTVEFTENGIKFIEVLASIPTFNDLRKKYRKLFKEANRI